MLYIILQKNRETDNVNVHSVLDDEMAAVARMDSLIDQNSDFGYRMDALEDDS